MPKNTFSLRATQLLGVYLLIAAIFYFPAISKISITLGDGWNEWGGAIFFKRWISQGVFPLWNPDIGFGVPDWTAINPVAFHQLLLLFLPPDIVWNVYKILNFVGAGWFLSLYLLRRLESFWPAFIGGLVSAIAQLNVDIIFASYFLFVLSFILADRLVRLKSYSAALVFAISFLIFCLSALPQPIMCASAFLFCYIAFSLSLHKSFNIRLGLIALFPFVISFLFLLPQILRVKEALDLSVRSNLADVEVFSVYPWEYVHFFWPNFFFNSQDVSLNIIPGRMLATLQNYLSNFVNVRFTSFFYYGTLPFFAILCLFFKNNLKGIEKTFLWLAVFLILGIPILNPIFYPLIKQIPFLGLASSHSLFGAVYSVILLLMVSVLTASSVKYLSITKQASVFKVEQIKKLFLIVTFFVGLVSLCRLLIHFGFYFKGEFIESSLNTWLSSFFSSGQFKQTPEFYGQRIDQALHFLKLWSSPQNIYFVVPVFLSLGSLGIIYCRLTEKIGKIPFFIGCLVLLLIDAKIFHPMTFFTQKELAPYHAEADFIKQDKGIFRIMALQDNSPEGVDARADDIRNVILRPESQQIYGLSSPESLRSVILKGLNDYMQKMTVEGGTKGRLVGEIEIIRDPELLDLANIKYLIVPLSKGLNEFPTDRYELIHETKCCRIFKNKLSKERAFLINDNESNSTVIEHYSPHLVQIQVQTRSPNELVLTDQYYPGWSAYIDGMSIPIMKYEETFRKISIPAGEHKIEFKFNPTHFPNIMIFPLVGFILGICVLIYRG